MLDHPGRPPLEQRQHPVEVVGDTDELIGFRRALFDHREAVLDRFHAAFEFRHASWFDDEVLDILRERGLALCVADSEKLSTPVEITASYAYFRLRDEGYTPDDIARWAETIARATESCRDVFVYFKHEEEGKGPEFANLLMRHLGLAGA